jgi:membrane associated rhomboid family serine protease
MNTGHNGSGNGHDHGGDDSGNDEPNVIRLPLQDNNPPPPPSAREPLINLPPVTKYFIFLLIAIHGALQLFTEEQRGWIYSHFGFVAGAYTGHAPFTATAIIAPLTYMLLHGSWMHVGMNCVMLAAFGAGLERMMGGRKLLILFVLCGLAAIAVQFIAYPASTDPVIGASGGITGFFAALLVVMQQMNGNRGRYGLWPLIIVWIAVEATFGLTGAGPGGGNVAWIAHIGGFLAGLFLVKPVLRKF